VFWEWMRHLQPPNTRIRMFFVPKLELGNEMTGGRAHPTRTGWKPVPPYSKNPVKGEEAAAVSRSGPRPAR
jgi:hypothetical protein